MQFQNFGHHRPKFLFATIAWTNFCFLVVPCWHRRLQQAWHSKLLGLMSLTSVRTARKEDTGIWRAQLFAKLVCLSSWSHLAWTLFVNLWHALDFVPVGRGWQQGLLRIHTLRRNLSVCSSVAPHILKPNIIASFLMNVRPLRNQKGWSLHVHCLGTGNIHAIPSSLWEKSHCSW